MAIHECPSGCPYLLRKNTSHGIAVVPGNKGGFCSAVKEAKKEDYKVGYYRFHINCDHKDLHGLADGTTVICLEVIKPAV